MIKKKYNKLVRDKIPEIIRANGVEPVIRLASEQEYGEKLREKLQEEVAEYLESGATEELADILEVVHALASLDDHSPALLEGLRAEKAKSRGGFMERVILEEA